MQFYEEVVCMGVRRGLSRYGVMMIFIFVLLIGYPPPKVQASTLLMGGTLKSAIRAYIERGGHGRGDVSARYVAELAHLNNTGNIYAIVYLTGDTLCGSGGCPMLIFERNSTSWVKVSGTLITWPPICILNKTSHGWHSIAVWIQGGGIQPGYLSALPFDGHEYPLNPTTSPAVPVSSGTNCKILIPSTRNSESVY